MGLVLGFICVYPNNLKLRDSASLTGVVVAAPFAGVVISIKRDNKENDASQLGRMEGLDARTFR